MLRTVDFKELDFNTSSRPRTKDTFNADVKVPDVCPMCGFSIAPIVLPSYSIKNDIGQQFLFGVFFCQHCMRAFIAQYPVYSENPILIAPRLFQRRVFDDKICQLSPCFAETYNQAFEAETAGLNEIAGIGYRKSIEYLIKDYLIRRTPEAEETIRNEALGSCIHNRIDHQRLKTVASRAVWIGNDFTHYTRKYEECDVSDMKNFIEATLHWILMELITDEAESMDRR